MQPNDSFLDYTFNNSKHVPMSSYATQWEPSKSHTQLHHDSQTYHEKNYAPPRFLSLANNYNKLSMEELRVELGQDRQSKGECFSIFSNLCKCVQIEKDGVGTASSKKAEPNRMDLRHLTKKKQVQVSSSNKPSLTPINSLVNLLDVRK